MSDEVEEIKSVSELKVRQPLMPREGEVRGKAGVEG